MKKWYKSNTIRLLLGQLLGIWAAHISGEVSLIATIGITMTTIGGVIIRFKTNQPIQRAGNGR